MQILVTGSKGFIGKNLTAELKNRDYNNIYEITRETSTEQYDEYCSSCDFVFHLLGINRTEEEAEFMEGNYHETKKLVASLIKHGSRAPILYASSTQALLDNPYGRSKLAAEELLIEYGKEYGVKIYIYRLPNVFGKWSRPDYNSAISTFCYKISRNMPIDIHDPDTVLKLAYIDDVIHELILSMEEYRQNGGNHIYHIQSIYHATLGRIAAMLHEFNEMRIMKQIPDMSDGFIRKLYSTYISFLPENDFKNPLRKTSDERGAFIEFLKSSSQGQISVNIIKPGKKKGGHWHHTKNEKFFILQGYGIIIFKRVNDDNIIKYIVNGDIPEAVDIPPGYEHTIINQSDVDMIVIIWADEIYNPEQPDTYS